MMKALIVERDGRLSVRDVSMPKYNDYQALVKILACGICNGTDSKLIHRKFKGFGPDLYPLILGHEAVGRVVATGSKVKGFNTGDLVLLPFNDAIDGIYSGFGGFAEYGIVNDPVSMAAELPADPDLLGRAYAQTVLPAGMDPVEAVMVVTLREVLSSIRLFDIKENDSVVVFGCGPVGLTFIRQLYLLGVKPIIACDIDEAKVRQARELGAHAAYNNSQVDMREAVRKMVPGGVQFVIDAVGISAIINEAMGILCDHGRICCYGISPNLSYEIDWADAPYNWTLQFQQMPAKIDEYHAHNQVMAWVETGVIKLADYISEVVDFADILEAFRRLEEKKITKKSVVRFPE
jgi:L-iditol 2-dehydrogenase